MGREVLLQVGSGRVHHFRLQHGMRSAAYGFKTAMQLVMQPRWEATSAPPLCWASLVCHLAPL